MRANKLGFVLCLPVLGLLFAACSSSSYVSSGSVSGKEITYQSSSENFLNPERGFHQGFQLMDTADFSGVRKAGSSMITAYVRLDSYRTTALPQDFLSKLRSRLDAVRSAGLKINPRFVYSFPNYDPGNTPVPNASLDMILQHISQLKPIFSDYSDIILAVQAGFVGAWGEWNSNDSLPELMTSDSKRKIIDALLAALPKDRMLQLRYPGDVKQFYPSALSTSQAFDGSSQSRLGFHNDCFLANESDAGTYPESERPALKDYIAKISAFTPVGGETCQVSPDKWRTDCPTTLKEMSDQHWSFISGTWYRPILDQWKSEGCYNQIALRLGYRFSLTKAVIPDQASGRLRMSFEVKNEGFAAPFNPRPVQIVLRNRSSKAVFSLPVTSADPRRWAAGQTTNVVVDVPLASGVSAGDYDVLLYLPDASAKIASRPEYAIRLANQNVWEAATGYNSLGHILKVQ